ncbi:hypothetical protein [Deinococcus hopiensis]|uniref:Uncharacterized protein n=1 Tax=Deinococcus hopiensis KR-140 TaxID=695939 RepID=A0A1W1VJ41_9DEIO|nr:hypothetical protein [Deinococcus hopiensis]SMB93382.1 hypothetical protein SAMN00790413_01959 [Deinococcus hopiensis KR-140]
MTRPARSLFRTLLLLALAYALVPHVITNPWASLGFCVTFVAAFAHAVMTLALLINPDT